MYTIDQYTSCLLHFEDGLRDETGKVWTSVNNANVSNTCSKVGSSSLSLNGVNQYITTPDSADFDLGTGDFTIDFWAYMNAEPSPYYVVFTTTTPGGISAAIAPNRISIGRTMVADDIIVNPTIPLNQWVHIAIVRASSIVTIFLNGTKVGSATVTASYPQSGLNIGIEGDNQAYPFNGYIDEFRISKGIARWTKDFPPPGEPYSLLRVTMIDSSEREYKLTTAEADGFINWYTRTIGTGISCYALNDIVDNSKEYLSFEKIISFKVIPLGA